MLQSVFAVMDHHPAYESVPLHFSGHLSAPDSLHGHHHHGDKDHFITAEQLTSDLIDEEHSCAEHFHGIKLVALPFSSAIALETAALTHMRSELATHVRSAFPPPRFRPPIA